MRQLEMFSNTMKYGTISMAAKQMNISQPSASRLIADLERSIGFSLFIREKGRLLPSPEGIKFFQEVERSFNALVSLESFAENIKKQRSDSLRIAVSPALSTVFVPNIIKLFRKSYPDARISILAHSPTIIFDLLQSNTVDLAFNNKMVSLPNVIEERLIEANFICAIPKGHKLAEKQLIIPADLEGEDFIDLVAEEGHSWRQHDDMLKKYNIQPNILYSTQRAPSAYGMVEAGLGIGLFEPFSYAAWSNSNVIARPFLPKLTYSFAAYYPSNHIRSEFARAFVEISKQYLSNNPLPFAKFYEEN